MVVLVYVIAVALRPERSNRIWDGQHHPQFRLNIYCAPKFRKCVLICLSSLLIARRWLSCVPIDVLIHKIVLEPDGAASTVRNKRWSANVEHAAPASASPAKTGREAIRKTTATNRHIHLPGLVRETAALAKRATLEIPRINFLPADTSKPPL